MLALAAINSSLAISRISRLLILAVISNVIVLLSSSSSSAAFDLKRSLSMTEGLGGLLTKQHDNGKQVGSLQYASDDSLITPQAKSNKVSKALRFLHNKAGDVIYKRKGSIKQDVSFARSQSMNGNLIAENRSEMHSEGNFNEEDNLKATNNVQMFSDKTDDQIIEDACKEHPTRTCSYAVKTALKSKPEYKAKIALALRRKPDYVDASKLLYHKLFESAISMVEEKNLDSKLDAGLGLVLSKTPYGFAANQALNLAVKTL